MRAIARKYASALLEVAREQGILEHVAADLERISRDREVWEMLASSQTREEEREQLLKKGFADHVCALTFSFLRMVNRKGRLQWVPEIARTFETLHDDLRGRGRGEAWTVMELSDQEMTDLEHRMSGLLDKHITLTQKIDASLLGGVTVVVNFRAFDGSARRRLDDLRLALLA